MTVFACTCHEALGQSTERFDDPTSAAATREVATDDAPPNAQIVPAAASAPSPSSELPPQPLSPPQPTSTAATATDVPSAVSEPSPSARLTVKHPPRAVYPADDEVGWCDTTGEPPPQLWLPKELPYDGPSVPDGYVIEHRTVKALWISGTATLVSAWALSTAIGVERRDEILAVPLAGPWIHWYQHRLSRRTRRNSIILGSVQGLGATLLVAGLVIDDPRYLRADLAGVQLAPSVSADGWGVSGTF